MERIGEPSRSENHQDWVAEQEGRAGPVSRPQLGTGGGAGGFVKGKYDRRPGFGG